MRPGDTGGSLRQCLPALQWFERINAARNEVPSSVGICIPRQNIAERDGRAKDSPRNNPRALCCHRAVTATDGVIV